MQTAGDGIGQISWTRAGKLGEAGQLVQSMFMVLVNSSTRSRTSRPLDRAGSPIGNEPALPRSATALTVAVISGMKLRIFRTWPRWAIRRALSESR